MRPTGFDESIGVNKGSNEADRSDCERRVGHEGTTTEVSIGLAKAHLTVTRTSLPSAKQAPLSLILLKEK